MSRWRFLLRDLAPATSAFAGSWHLASPRQVAGSVIPTYVIHMRGFVLILAPMTIRNLIVKFTTRVWGGTRKGFWLPKPLARAFGWKEGKKRKVHLVITKSGKRAFEGDALLVSETEIATPHIFEKLHHGDEIQVTVTRFADIE